MLTIIKSKYFSTPNVIMNRNNVATDAKLLSGTEKGRSNGVPNNVY